MIRSLIGMTALLGATAFVALPAPASAAKEDVPAAAVAPAPVTVAGAYAFATSEGQTTGAVFLRIINTGDADQLLSAASPAAKVVELHEHVMDGDVMGMRKVERIAVPTGTLKMNPMGYHVMLIDLTAPLREGQSVPVTLTFEKAGTVDLTASVVPPGQIPEAEKDASESHGDMDHSAHDNDAHDKGAHDKDEHAGH